MSLQTHSAAFTHSRPCTHHVGHVLVFVSGVPRNKGGTRANHRMSVPSKHDKERLCTLTSLIRAQGLAGVLFCFFPLTLFLTKVNRGHLREDIPVRGERVAS